MLLKARDGKLKDDALYEKKWQTLGGILGRSDFLYVADFKLCVRKTPMNINLNRGPFIAITVRAQSQVEQ